LQESSVSLQPATIPTIAVVKPTSGE